MAKLLLLPVLKLSARVQVRREDLATLRTQLRGTGAASAAAACERVRTHVDAITAALPAALADADALLAALPAEDLDAAAWDGTLSMLFANRSVTYHCDTDRGGTLLYLVHTDRGETVSFPGLVYFGFVLRSRLPLQASAALPAALADADALLAALPAEDQDAAAWDGALPMLFANRSCTH